ncbi:unnamed protein product [Mytilus coruscus]|uniref:ANK n=1 Tax=Mytilus coruscus TaxID=42192 RepID=A0A6J8E0F4_MYTCO|nr:unnamed protein product [Mytilus coruscus]
MLERGANVNSLESQYALKRLIINGRDTQLLECLKDNGIGMHFIDYKRKSLLFYAITSKNLQIQTFLVEEDSKQHALHEAVFYSNIENLIDLLSSHDINLVSNNGWSVIHFAAYRNDIAMMEIIFETAMKNELSVMDKRDKIGWSPLHLASILSNYEAVDFLMSKGANASSIDNDGKTPLHLSSNEQITGSLLQYNRCSIEMSTNTEQHSTELQHQHTKDNTNDINKTKDIVISIKDVHIEMANTHFFSNEFIRENSIEFKQDEDKNWKPHVNNYPIHQDIMNEIPENMKNWHPSLFSLIRVTYMNFLFWCFSIVKFRENIDIPDKEGNTRLHAAASMENQDDSISSVKMLLESGANPLFYNNNGCMAADVAFYRRSYKVKLFLDIYALHAAKRMLGILVFILIIAFLSVISLSLAAYYICPDYTNDNNLKNTSTRQERFSSTFAKTCYDLNYGFDIDGTQLSILLYADDIFIFDRRENFNK